ncbi:4-(cytidine 5'-diphospho)-2-C-methyl-D-erythritol kinase [Roseovarius spongiae]|uniref:4-diphosphocytidyl-2-C-methyl-D-erythritol kinase n=1 Tax=Roseovarius spongiae TaxID=2320272 RepID=A0A3A8BA47_9RHOB|nr:4-(cytidine 5'-diphospho)-2-C-methyl-D-erythritol kinase [Roseovarius spongiae]RKF15395.1 4-(cytidine 5'-diphospho)-2-C-methyl-D-erythritol kinase [Roseovarius spongiae]
MGDTLEHGTRARVVEAFAPAKVNLTLHVTGQREDGYHTLDSLVMFADVGDHVRVSKAAKTTLRMVGPTAHNVPKGGDNLVLRAAALMGATASITLEKHLPMSAGLGGGSADAVATIRALAELTGQPAPADLLPLGADAPVCAADAGAARMRGIGEQVTAVHGLPTLDAVLVNPKIPVLTDEVFRRLRNRDNTPLPDPIPTGEDAAALIEWLKGTRNDLEEPAIECEPVIAQVFSTLEVTPGCLLTRMSGSGGTCFGLYADAETAASAAGRLSESHPNWWVTATQLNA